MRLPAALAIAAVAVLSSRDARADHTRVILVSMPDEVLAATTAALGPWQIVVEADPDPAPQTNAEAAEIARAHDATAVAWIDRDELVIYDDLRGASERHATATPIDDAAAASIALSIKTSLRQNGTVVVTVPDDGNDPIVIERDRVVPVRVEVERKPRYTPHVLAGLGAGIPIDGSAPTMMRVAARVSLDLPPLAHLGVLAGVEAGPSADVSGPMLTTGSYRDITIHAGTEWRQPLAPRWWLVPAVLGTFHLTHLDGTMPTGAGGERRIDDAANAYGVQVELGVEAGRRIRGGATVYGSFLGGIDPFKAGNDTLLTVPTATVGIALRMSFQ